MPIMAFLLAASRISGHVRSEYLLLLLIFLSFLALESRLCVTENLLGPA